jgi:hypothetical protein
LLRLLLFLLPLENLFEDVARLSLAVERFAGPSLLARLLALLAILLGGLLLALLLRLGLLLPRPALLRLVALLSLLAGLGLLRWLLPGLTLVAVLLV